MAGTVDTQSSGAMFLMDPVMDKYVDLRGYQRQIYESIEKQWFDEE